MVFVSSIAANYFVVAESLSGRVPCLGISDTDAFSQGASLAVPGNDDSVACVLFYHDLLAEYILYRKFVSLYLWFLHIRRRKRLMGFYDWLLLRRPLLSGPPLGGFFSYYLAVPRLSLERAAAKVLLG